MFSAKTLKFSFGLFLIIVGIFAVVQMPLIGLPVLGGVITQGILGGFSGKVGPVVGGKWKDIQYMRGYVTPANPNTAGQQVVRAKFSKMILLARGLLTSILNVYWDPFYSNMSGFNAFVSKNYDLLDGSSDLPATAIISDGTLEPIPSLTATYITITGSVSCVFSDDCSGNGLDTDYVQAVAYDKNLELFYFDDGSTSRGEGTLSFTIPQGKTATNVIVFLFCFRGTGSAFTVSTSIGDICAA